MGITHDTYNPWHGCKKISEGCEHCYMYFLDKQWDRDTSIVKKTKSAFKYPLQKYRNGDYKIRSGEHIRVGMTSDFFIEDADPWRPEVWKMLRFRSDVVWRIITKRAYRMKYCLPPDWDDGYDNVVVQVTAENQRRADERLPMLLDMRAKHKAVICAPLLGPIDLSRYLATGRIEQVLAGGENYDGCRPCDYAWAKSLYDQCRKYDVEFNFYETGTRFVKDGVETWNPRRRDQSIVAYHLGLYNPSSKTPDYGLTLPGTDVPVPPERLHEKRFLRATCHECADSRTCNGCSECGNCSCSTPY